MTVAVLVVPATKKVKSTVSRATSSKLLHLAPSSDQVPIEEQSTLLLVRDLLRFGWRLHPGKSNKHALELIPPEIYEKDVSRQAMAYARDEVLEQNKDWIAKKLPLARKNLALGKDVLHSPIIPRIEVCHSQKQHDIFRIFRYFWSSPYSEYVGRRIRLIIRDDGLPNSPVIGIAALGSSIIHIQDRDEWIGWDIATRTERIIYMMDAYVLGAVPPYNHLLGGKLISYILASNEIRKVYRDKYLTAKTLMRGRKASDLALIVTTSLYGKQSSQYNRIKYDGRLLYEPIGETTGFGSLHISDQTFGAFRQLLQSKNGIPSNRFGSGANWRIRVIREACETLGLDAETILKHSFQRGLFALSLASNARNYLNGDAQNLDYFDYSLDDLVSYWRERWFKMRLTNTEVTRQVEKFEPSQFVI